MTRARLFGGVERDDVVRGRRRRARALVLRGELVSRGKPMTLRYLPVGRRVEGPGGVRRSDVPDVACNAG